VERALYVIDATLYVRRCLTGSQGKLARTLVYALGIWRERRRALNFIVYFLKRYIFSSNGIPELML